MTCHSLLPVDHLTLFIGYNFLHNSAVGYLHFSGFEEVDHTKPCYNASTSHRLDERAGPDPFLVDQVEASLYHLHALHINAACEERLIYIFVETSTCEW